MYKGCQKNSDLRSLKFKPSISLKTLAWKNYTVEPPLMVISAQWLPFYNGHFFVPADVQSIHWLLFNPQSLQRQWPQ